MIKRKIVFVCDDSLGDYDTAAFGWTLSKCDLAAAEQKTTYVDKPSGDGTWDLSTALTDGVPRYKDRKLTAVLECSVGDRRSREAKLRQMINRLDGLRAQIYLPDDDLHYLVGRIKVERNQNSYAYAQVTVTATCEPWKYAKDETIVSLKASESIKTTQIVNSGRRVTVPSLCVDGVSARLTLRGESVAFADSGGEYVNWPLFPLYPGNNEMQYSGDSTISIKYREAVLE